VEPFGIDESWLDVSGCLHLFRMTGSELADHIRETVKTELGLTLSIGVSFNKIFAKLGSDYRKPDATTVIDRGNFKEIVYPLPVSVLLYVGKVATETLARVGVKTIGHLAALDRQTCVSLLGKMGDLVHDYANGLDESSVIPESQQQTAKSVGNGMTFPRDLLGRDDILWGVALLVDSSECGCGVHGSGVALCRSSSAARTSSRSPARRNWITLRTRRRGSPRSRWRSSARHGRWTHRSG
jgi:DNA polymerase IV